MELVKKDIDTNTSFIYSIHKNNNNTIRKIEYNNTVRDADKMIDTHYNNIIKNTEQYESFTKLLKDKSDVWEQVGSSKNKTDWTVQEFHNSTFQKKYTDKYTKHKFDEHIMDYMQQMQMPNNNFMIE
jgi:hypothetical protein